MKRNIVPVALAIGLAGCAMEQQAQAPSPAYEAAKAAVPEVLTDGSGMTLYYFDRDVVGSGKSACNGGCATNWPPQPASADSTPFGDYTIVTRDDGSRQWAYKGRPLYRWAKDAKAGDRTGDNFNNVWHVATP